MFKQVFLFLIFLCASNAAVMAHAIHFETSNRPPVITVKSYFSKTSPVSNAIVEIFAPGEQQPYQTGRTDKAGNFAFLPVASGEWLVTVDDQAGHRGRVVVDVSDDFFIQEEQAVILPAGEMHHDQIHEHDHGFSVLYRIIFGLSLIFGITGIIYGIRAKKEV
jgi:nickel transport protein